MTPEQAEEAVRNARTNRTIIDAFNSGGLADTAEWFADDVRYVDPDLPGPIEGRSAVLAHNQSMLTGFDSWQVRSIDMFLAGDCIVSVTTAVGAGEGTRGEMEIEVRTAHVTRFSGGKVVEWRVFPQVADAFREAGLDPDHPGEPWAPTA